MNKNAYLRSNLANVTLSKGLPIYNLPVLNGTHIRNNQSLLNNRNNGSKTLPDSSDARVQKRPFANYRSTGD